MVPWKIRWSRMSFLLEALGSLWRLGWRKVDESGTLGRAFGQWDVDTCFVCSYTIDVLNFGAVQFIIFLSLVILMSYLRNHCLTQSQENLFLFSSKSLIALTLSFRSMIHFDFIFTYGVRWGFAFILLHVEYSCHSTICYKEYSFSI